MSTERQVMEMSDYEREGMPAIRGALDAASNSA